ncbi:MAG: exo-alpha-sialidase [Bacteroidia bacterium]|nr:exo-alpha-sialidase [Bacteroidia bacterium]
MRVYIIFLCLCSFTVSAQFKNIMLAEQKDGVYPPLEPSIAINKKDPNNIVAGIVLDRAIYTKDGGISWQESILTSPYGVFGDPAVISNAKGEIYFFHLADPSGKGRNDDAWLDRIVCQKSTDGGATWSSGSSIGFEPPKDQDKQWPAVHPKKDYVYTTWTQFDKYGSPDSTCHSNIMFSMPTSGGKKWSDARQINQYSGDCLDGDNTTEGAVPTVSLEGKIFVAWSNKNKIYFDRSYDDGKMWLQNDIAIADQPGGWEMDIPGLSRSNGMPVLMIDNSPSRYHGSLYLVWADQRNGESDTDIWLMRSGNRGDNWTSPIRINKDTVETGAKGKHQFLPWLAVDQATGFIYIVYYDRRNYDDLQTDVYLAYSTDGGSLFTETKISESSFVPTESKFFGDYNNISAHKGVITPIWTRMDDGRTSVWTTVIKDTDLLKK